MVENKKIIYDTARKDKKFLRVLKECRLYGRYFHMLENYGFNCPPTSQMPKLNMEEYVMSGFGWVNDNMFYTAWANLYETVKATKELTGHKLYKSLKKNDKYHRILLETNRK